MNDYQTLASIARALSDPAPVNAARTLEPTGELARAFLRMRAGTFCPVLALTPQVR